jgi:hypothetical protein
MSICKKYIHIKLDSLGNKDGKSFKCFSEVLERLGKKHNEVFIFGIKMFKIGKL